VEEETLLKKKAGEVEVREYLKAKDHTEPSTGLGYRLLGKSPLPSTSVISNTGGPGVALTDGVTLGDRDTDDEAVTLDEGLDMLTTRAFNSMFEIVPENTTVPGRGARAPMRALEEELVQAVAAREISVVEMESPS